MLKNELEFSFLCLRKHLSVSLNLVFGLAYKNMNKSRDFSDMLDT